MSDIKITLFSYNASHSHTNLAIRSLRTALYELSDVPEIYLTEFSLKDKRNFVLNTLYNQNSNIYAFSTYIWNITETKELARNLKKLRPDSLIVFGGPEVSYTANEFLKDNPYVDIIMCGEGEEIIKDLILSYPDVDKIIYGRPDEKFSLRGPHYFLQNGECEDIEKGKMLYYESTRGCPYTCKYCLSGSDTRVRAKSTEKTLKDLLMFEKIPGGKRIIKFIDRTFNYNLRRAKDIWIGLLSDEYTNTYHFEIEPALFDEEAFEILRKAPKGKFQLEAGIQSTNLDVLDKSGRHANLEKELKNLAILKEIENVPVHADLICGLPSEDFNSVRRSYNMVYPVCNELQLGFLKLLYGAKLTEEANLYGMVYREEPPYEILKTDTLSYDEMYILHGLADVTDRISNSEKFKNTLNYILNSGKVENLTPFDFLLDFAKDILHSPYQIGQSAMYEKIYSFGLKYLKEEDKEEFKEKVRNDFLENEKTRIPYILRPDNNLSDN